MGLAEDLWHAVNTTEVIVHPQKNIEAFGSTIIHYQLLSELMDDVNKIRVREGKIHTERPQIITPSHFSSLLLDGFGEQASEYCNWLKKNQELVHILKFGLQFRKDSNSTMLISGSLTDISSRFKENAETQDDPSMTVLIGADELWEVSLLKFTIDHIQHCLPKTLQELGRKENSEENRIKRDIEASFQAVRKNSNLLHELGEKLKKYGLFERYEDRFYALLRQVKR